MTHSPRQGDLLQQVRSAGSVSVQALAERSGVTLQSVRRDATQRAEAGLLTRVHGGARLPGSTVETIAHRQRRHLRHRPRLSESNFA